ncbi:UvrABC system protein A [Streptomyces violaceorubidus]
MSTSPASLTCTSLSFAWPDGTTVFEGLDVAFGPGRTGLVGVNGAGKSTLLKLIAGELTPADGAVRVTGEVGYLPQNVTLDTALRVDEALGIDGRRAALHAIEAGDVSEEHFETVGDDWDVEERALATLGGLGLGHVGLDRTVGEVSGGESVLLRLAALLLRRPDVLLLDEPTNNLDVYARGRLYAAVESWPGVMVVVSHDRELLERVDQIADLRSGSVTWYGGNLTAYEEALAVEQEAAERMVRRSPSRTAARLAPAERAGGPARRRCRGGRAGAAIGLGYLSLDRETATLSGGEGQRLKTVRHLGSSLTGMTYIFDEPSVGLHPRDVGRLGDLLLRLRDKGNTVLVVEHDPDVIALADHVVDMGPRAGADGGRVVFEGTPDELAASDTLTGRCLGRRTAVKENVRTPTGELWVKGADRHNLREVTVAFATGVLTAVTGVAGSGKSTLVAELTAAHPDAVVVDQSAIGISARSTPATYLGIMDTVRKIFARETGAEPGFFSFNSAGACGTCEGRGIIHTDLAFMDPVTTTCHDCEGRRFREEVLRLTVDGRSVADVLAMTADQALGFFSDTGVRRRLRALRDVGLTYLTLGQPLSTLSGGERQRIKLATRLHRTGAVYVLDEPTTGLHMSDVEGLLALLDRLVDSGNTVVVVEHNLDVVAHADRVIDLGPDGGRDGGRVIFEGTPRELLAAHNSSTAEHLRRATRG